MHGRTVDDTIDQTGRRAIVGESKWAAGCAQHIAPIAPCQDCVAEENDLLGQFCLRSAVPWRRCRHLAAAAAVASLLPTSACPSADLLSHGGGSAAWGMLAIACLAAHPLWVCHDKSDIFASYCLPSVLEHATGHVNWLGELPCRYHYDLRESTCSHPVRNASVADWSQSTCVSRRTSCIVLPRAAVAAKAHLQQDYHQWAESLQTLHA